MDAVRRRGNSLIGYLNQTKGEAQGVIGKETAVTFVTRDGDILVFCGLDHVHGLIWFNPYIWSCPISVFTHHGHRVALSDIDVP